MEESFIRNKVWLAIPVFLLLMMFSSCTIVRHDQDKNVQKNNGSSFSSDDTSFDVHQYVVGIWEDKIVREMVDNAVDLEFLISGLKTNRDKFEKQYGRRQQDASSYNYIVKGTYSVEAVHTKSASGTLELNLKDVGGESRVLIQIGPVIKSSSVRDVLSFIQFGDFENQIQFASVSREINLYIYDHVLASFDKENLEGKNIDFLGAFTWSDDGSVLITPISISGKGS